MATNDKKRPVKEIRNGSVKLAIWANETTNGSRYSVTAQRLYKDADDNWQSTGNLNASDLPNLVLAAVSADIYIRSTVANAKAGVSQ